MRKLLITFLLFLAVLEGLSHVHLSSLLVAFVVILGLVACVHFLVTPAGPDTG